MENNCGECRHLTGVKSIGICEKQGMPLCPAELPACSKFEQKEELKPCPFCGGSNTIKRSSQYSNQVYHECNECGCSVAFYSEERDTWNTRPAEDAKDKEIERLKVDLDARNSALKIAFHDIKRAGEEIDKWKKMFYDLINKQSSISTDPKVIVVGTDTNVPTKESEEQSK